MQTSVINSYLGDELANKVKHLNKALVQATQIISRLESENNRLRDVLIGLASENNKDLVPDSEAMGV